MSRCSECSARVRPIVAVDIDGTLAEYHKHLGDHICRYFGMEWKQHPIYDPWDGEGNYEDYFGITQAQYREAKLAFRQGGFKRWAPVMPGVAALRHTLTGLKQTHDLEVWVTTTRPWNRLDSTDPDTRHWLDRHFPLYDHLLYDDNKYERLAEIVDRDRVVAVVDDLPEMWAQAARVFGH
ncbi:MAG: hypothetical protein GTO49_33345, partial [Anaerolineae bacterium]|nr:hypothetical protein [Anaerolineae bacterium]